MSASSVSVITASCRWKQGGQKCQAGMAVLFAFLDIELYGVYLAKSLWQDHLAKPRPSAVSQALRRHNKLLLL